MRPGYGGGQHSTYGTGPYGGDQQPGHNAAHVPHPFGAFPGQEEAPAPRPQFADAVGSPPFGWLIAALAVAVAAGTASLLVAGASIVIAAVCWAAAGPLAVGLVAHYSVADTRQQARVVYTRGAWATPLYWTTVVIVLAAVIACAWRIADWAGRL
jgi:hypothetical protein